MKRLHVHLSVDDLDHSIAYYATLFGTPPQKVRDGYARWMLEDPKVNFALSTGRRETGITHLGIQAESDSELEEVEARIAKAGEPYAASKETHCCYAETRQGWATDPQGVKWEAFVTRGDSENFTGPVAATAAESESACCAPTCCA